MYAGWEPAASWLKESGVGPRNAKPARATTRGFRVRCMDASPCSIRQWTAASLQLYRTDRPLTNIIVASLRRLDRHLMNLFILGGYALAGKNINQQTGQNQGCRHQG